MGNSSSSGADTDAIAGMNLEEEENNAAAVPQPGRPRRTGVRSTAEVRGMHQQVRMENRLSLCLFDIRQRGSEAASMTSFLSFQIVGQRMCLHDKV